MKNVVVTGYEEVREICRRPEVFSSAHVNIHQTIGQEGPMIPIEVDAPDHPSPIGQPGVEATAGQHPQLGVAAVHYPRHSGRALVHRARLSQR